MKFFFLILGLFFKLESHYAAKSIFFFLNDFKKITFFENVIFPFLIIGQDSLFIDRNQVRPTRASLH